MAFALVYCVQKGIRCECVCLTMCHRFYQAETLILFNLMLDLHVISSVQHISSGDMLDSAHEARLIYCCEQMAHRVNDTNRKLFVESFHFIAAQCNHGWANMACSRLFLVLFG